MAFSGPHISGSRESTYSFHQPYNNISSTKSSTHQAQQKKGQAHTFQAAKLEAGGREDPPELTRLQAVCNLKAQEPILTLSLKDPYFFIKASKINCGDFPKRTYIASDDLLIPILDRHLKESSDWMQIKYFKDPRFYTYFPFVMHWWINSVAAKWYVRFAESNIVRKIDSDVCYGLQRESQVFKSSYRQPTRDVFLFEAHLPHTSSQEFYSMVEAWQGNLPQKKSALIKVMTTANQLALNSLSEILSTELASKINFNLESRGLESLAKLATQIKWCLLTRNLHAFEKLQARFIQNRDATTQQGDAEKVEIFDRNLLRLKEFGVNFNE